MILGPGTFIRSLSLRSLGARLATLADGRQSAIRVFAGKVLWGDAPTDVPVLETAGGALVGMALLWGYRLTLEATPNGRVVIEKIGSG